MFEKTKRRYLTSGVDNTIPPDIQGFLWSAIDQMPEPKDYLQVFQLTVEYGYQEIDHTSEQPEYHMHYILAEVLKLVEAKVYVIDSGEYCTMLLAEEY